MTGEGRSGGLENERLVGRLAGALGLLVGSEFAGRAALGSRFRGLHQAMMLILNKIPIFDFPILCVRPVDWAHAESP